MGTPIRIIIEDLVLEAELSDTPCAEAIARILPIEAVPHVWGDELYFEIPVSLPPDETATTRVNAGDIGYWPPGRALAIFFGRTPMSTDDRPVPASAVNPVGAIRGDAAVLRGVRGARRIRIEKV
ncbi:MAG: hypothetical protein KO206_01445 [Methanomicrobiaceae archaeon]|uniref:Cyclophilin TM1367-like domain-containing protein n=1 Tax=hydrocarbon metagenome TaxID=938273 RepID=A0A0W8FJJ5_9ZZZZ|nr:hypothetical protein [Methanomicrobiaceae archaeon]MDD5419969.1 cyclophilin-like fold protein [Methanomicrobiaceae archaeon]